MTRKLFSLVIVTGILLISPEAQAQDTAVLGSEFRDAITNSRTTYSPIKAGETYSIRVRVLETSGKRANNVLGLYRFKRSQLNFIGPADDCAELDPFVPSDNNGKIMCAFNAVTGRKTRTLNFDLVNPDDCGDGKTLALGTSFVASGTNTLGGVGSVPPTVEVECAEETEIGNEVDMNLRFSAHPPSSINSYDPFTLRLVAENIHPNQLDIFSTNVELNYPPVLQRIPGNDNCTEIEANKLSCNYFTLRPGKTKQISFRLKDSTIPCQEQVGTYAFSASGESNATISSQVRTEIDESNNSNIPSRSFTLSCDNVPDLRFSLTEDSHVDLVNPDGGSSLGSSGRWGGELFYRIDFYNTTNNDLNVGELEYNLENFSSAIELIDRVDFGASPSAGCQANRYRVICDFGTVPAGAKIAKSFSLVIKQPNPFGDRTPFDPLAICNLNRSNIRTFEISEIVDFNSLSGLNKDGKYFIPLDTQGLPGLDCMSQTYEP